MMLERQLEEYTTKHKDEALLVTIVVDDEEQQLIVFRGFTSSLTNPTPANPEEPVIPPGAELKTIDRVRAPYNPAAPVYLQRGLTWQDWQSLTER
ncbi:MAG: hypothetical protein RMK91_05335 [Pseudanabaenaceae cyanobacterium SKYGB_i_bin29]|nr:hypothetical protein [Pseudanabaenaceae cyanobacterium SKYG29]MDW8421271.1 hypothetical protein [Pseudanabaenaceae cyanobacterium SKYGB_i_bin29]